jgi:glycosyltransferase involved in cell wall biosynthesis
MKIIYIHQYFNTPEMSGGTRSYEIARRLVGTGHEVIMITSWRDHYTNKNWFQTEEAGIRVYWLPVRYSNNMGFLKRIFAFVNFAIKSSKLSATLAGDVVFATSTPLTIAIPAVLVSNKLKVPMVFEVRDLWPALPIAIGVIRNPILKELARKLERWAYRHSSAIVTLSPGMKLGVIASGYPENKIAVIPNGSDIIQFDYDAVAERHLRSKLPWLRVDRPLLVYAGTFGKINGVGYAVELAKSLKNIGSNVLILLVGDGSERQCIVDMAKDLGVFQDNIYIESPMPKSNMPALFSAASMTLSLFVDLPEMRANSANKFFDSLAAGKPVLLNYGGWMHDLVIERACGLPMWKVPMDIVAAELDQAMNDSAWLAQSGSSARQLAIDYFDRNKLACQFEKLLMSVQDGKPWLASTIAPGIYK